MVWRVLYIVPVQSGTQQWCCKIPTKTLTVKCVRLTVRVVRSEVLRDNFRWNKMYVCKYKTKRSVQLTRQWRDSPTTWKIVFSCFFFLRDVQRVDCYRCSRNRSQHTAYRIIFVVANRLPVVCLFSIIFSLEIPFVNNSNTRATSVEDSSGRGGLW